MKKTFSVVLSLILICVLFIPTQAAGGTLTIKSDKSFANVGDTITVTVNLPSNSGLASLNFSLNYNNSELQYVSSSASQTFMAVINDKTAGKISYAGASVQTVNGSAVLLTAKFKVLKTNARLSVTVNEAGDGDNNKVTSSVGTSSLTVVCAHGTPNWQIEKDATCTEKGRKTAVCQYCSENLTEEIPVKGHNFGKWETVKEATETEKGEKHRVCSDCKKEEKAVIPVITNNITESQTEITTEPQTEPKAENITEKVSADNIENTAQNGENKTEKSTSKTSRVILFVVYSVVIFGLGIGTGIAITYLIKNKKRQYQ